MVNFTIVYLNASDYVVFVVALRVLDQSWPTGFLFSSGVLFDFTHNTNNFIRRHSNFRGVFSSNLQVIHIHTHTLEHENYYTNSSASKYRRINELFIFICGFFYRLFQILPSIILTTFFGFFLLSLYTRTIRFHTNALIAILSSVGYTAEKWISSNLHVCSHTIFQIKN